MHDCSVGSSTSFLTVDEKVSIVANQQHAIIIRLDCFHWKYIPKLSLSYFSDDLISVIIMTEMLYYYYNLFLKWDCFLKIVSYFLLLALFQAFYYILK